MIKPDSAPVSTKVDPRPAVAPKPQTLAEHSAARDYAIAALNKDIDVLRDRRDDINVEIKSLLVELKKWGKPRAKTAKK